MDPVNVICVGDSITYGRYIDQGGIPYPSQLLTLLGAGHSVINRGHPSWTLVDLLGNFPNDVTAALDGNKQNIVILFAATNDLYFSAALQSNPQPILDDMVEYIDLVHGVGAQIFIATMIQRGSVGSGSMAGYWSARSAINAAILSAAVASWGADGVCDFAGTASQFETQFTGNGPVGWYTDTAHLTGAALAYLAAEVYSAITPAVSAVVSAESFVARATLSPPTVSGFSQEHGVVVVGSFLAVATLTEPTVQGTGNGSIRGPDGAVLDLRDIYCNPLNLG